MRLLVILFLFAVILVAVAALNQPGTDFTYWVLNPLKTIDAIELWLLSYGFIVATSAFVVVNLGLLARWMVNKWYWG